MLSNISNKTKSQAAKISKLGNSEKNSDINQKDLATPRNESYVSSVAKKAYESLSGNSYNDMDEEDELTDENTEATQSRLRDSMLPQKGHGEAFNSSLEEEANPDYVDDEFNPKSKASSYPGDANVTTVNERGNTTEVRRPQKGEKFANYTYSSMVDPYISQKDVEESNQNIKNMKEQKNQSTPIDSTGTKSKGGIFKRKGSTKKSTGSQFDSQQGDRGSSKGFSEKQKDEVNTSRPTDYGSSMANPEQTLYGKGINTNDTSRVSEFANAEADPSTYHPNLKTPYEKKEMSSRVGETAGMGAGGHTGGSNTFDEPRNRKASTGSVGSYKSLPGTHGVVPGTPMTMEEAEMEEHLYKQESHDNPEDYGTYHIPGTMNEGIDTMHNRTKGVVTGGPAATSSKGKPAQEKEVYDNEISVSDNHPDQPLGAFLTQLEDERPRGRQMDHIENKDVMNTTGGNEYGVDNKVNTQVDSSSKQETSAGVGTGIVGGMLGYLGFKGAEGEAMDADNLPGALPKDSEYNDYKSSAGGMDTNGEGFTIPQDDRLGDTMGYVKDRNFTSVDPKIIGVLPSSKNDAKLSGVGTTESESSPYRFVQQEPDDLVLTQKNAKMLATDKSTGNYKQTDASGLKANKDLSGSLNDPVEKEKPLHANDMVNKNLSGAYAHISETSSTRAIIDSSEYGNKGFSPVDNNQYANYTDEYDDIYEAAGAHPSGGRKPLPSQTEAFVEGTKGEDSKLMSNFVAAKGSENNMKGHDAHGNSGPMHKIKNIFKKDPAKQQEQYERESAMNDPRHRNEAIGAASASGIAGATNVGGDKNNEETFGGIPTSPNTHKYTYSSKAATDMESPFVANKQGGRTMELKQGDNLNEATPSDDIPITSNYHKGVGAPLNDRRGFDQNREMSRKDGTSQSHMKEDASNKNDAVKESAEAQRASSAASAPIVGLGVRSPDAGAGMAEFKQDGAQMKQYLNETPVQQGAKLQHQNISNATPKKQLFSASGRPVNYGDDKGTFDKSQLRDERGITSDMNDQTKGTNTGGYPGETERLGKGSKDHDGVTDRHAESSPHSKKGLMGFFGSSKDSSKPKEPVEKTVINERGTVYKETHEDMADNSYSSQQPKFYMQQPIVKEGDIAHEEALNSNQERTEGDFHETTGLEVGNDMSGMHPANENFEVGADGRRKSFLTRMKEKIVH